MGITVCPVGEDEAAALCEADCGEETGTPAEEDLEVAGPTLALPLALALGATDPELAGGDEAPGEELPAGYQVLEETPGALLADEDEDAPAAEDETPAGDEEAHDEEVHNEDDEAQTEDDAALDPEDTPAELLPAAIDDEVGDGYGEMVMLTVPEDTDDAALDGHTLDDQALEGVRLETWP